MDKGSNTYNERQSKENTAEALFESFCNQKQYRFTRIGFDEKNKSVDHFYRINPYLRNIPDYIVNTGNATFIVNVKGTGNFKQKEIDMIPKFLEYYSTENAPLVYVFCFKDKDPIIISPENILKRYENGYDRRWSDGVVYRNLGL